MSQTYEEKIQGIRKRWPVNTQEHLELVLHDLEKAREALRFYADPKKWHQFIVGGGRMGSARSGDPAMMFDDGEDAPWSVAENALELVVQDSQTGSE